MMFKIIHKFSLMVIFSILTLGASKTAFATPNIDIYAQLPRTQSVRVSPDGNHIAMLAPYRGTKAVFVFNLHNPNANTIIIPTPDKSIVKGVRWASNKHVVILARLRGKGQGKMKKYSTLYSRWVSTNIETQKSVILLDDKIKNKNYRVTYGGGYVHSLPNDPDYVLMSFSDYVGKVVHRHFRVNLDTGKERLKRSNPVNTQNVVLSPDGERVLAREDYNRRNGKYQVFLGESVKEKLVFQATFDKTKQRTIYLVNIIKGKPLFQETEQDELTLFTIDPVTKQRSPFIFDADVPEGYEYGPIFDPLTNELIGVGYTDDSYKQVYSAEPYKTWHRNIKKALKGQKITIISRTKDNSMITIYADSPTNPGEFFLYETAKNSIESLGGMYPELEPSQIARTIRYDYTARDGLEIPAYLTLPPGKSISSGPMPMVVMPHGGPTARDDAGFDFWAQYLAAKGYVVFKPQFRGSTGFGHEFTEKGNGEFGGKMLTDTVDGVRYLIKTNVAQADKICVTGASYGGYQALALPMIEPDMFKCALSVNGVSQIRDILKFEEARTGFNSNAIKFWRKIIGDRYKDKDVMLAQSPAVNVDKIKAEIVLVHGTDDMTVPLQQSKVMSKALKKAGKSSTMILLPNDDHSLSLPQSRKTLLEASDVLFSKHLDE